MFDYTVQSNNKYAPYVLRNLTTYMSVYKLTIPVGLLFYIQWNSTCQGLLVKTNLTFDGQLQNSITFSDGFVLDSGFQTGTYNMIHRLLRF